MIGILDIKAYRREKRRRRREYKSCAREPLLDRENAFGVEDLTPYNAVRRIRTRRDPELLSIRYK